MSHPMLERKPTAAAVTVGSILTLISVVALGAILLQFIPPLGWYADHPFPASLSWLWAYSGDTLRQEWWRSAGMSLPQRLDWLVHATWTNAILPFDIVHAYRLRLTAVVIISAMVGMTGSLLFSLLSPYRDGLTHLTGRRLWRGYEAISKIRRTLRSAINCYGSGLAIAPSVVIDRAREVQHIGLCGTTGSGKTTILRALAQQVLSRNDKVVLHDTKGDVVAGLPAERFILMAPHDARSHAWDVAQDITSSQDARELAARLIHDSREPMWSGAAREILTGIVISLQRRQSRRWSWRDLANAAFMPTSDLLCLLQDHHPAAARYIEIDSQSGAPTRTTHGILITMWADVVGVIQPLASAWGDAPPERRFSLSRWLVDDKARLPKALVLQRSPRYPKLSEAWISAAMECLASRIASPELTESDRRRIFFLLDEFPQMGRINAFRQMLEVGRSKGIAIALGMQDFQQLIGTYGDAEAKTMLTLLGLKIIGRLPAGPSASYVATELIGQRDVAWKELTRSTNTGSRSNPGSVSFGTQSHRATIPVVSPQYLESRLGADRTGVTALLLGLGDVFELHWPFNEWSPRRPASQPADWTRT